MMFSFLEGIEDTLSLTGASLRVPLMILPRFMALPLLRWVYGSSSQEREVMGNNFKTKVTNIIPHLHYLLLLIATYGLQQISAYPYNQIHQNIYTRLTNKLMLLLLFLLACLLPLRQSTSSLKIGIPTNTNLQTGQVDLFSSTLPTTTTYFAITYATPMSTSSLQAGVAVAGLDAVIDVPQGFKLFVGIVNETVMVVSAQSMYTYGGPSAQISSMKVRFVVSCHPYLEISYHQRTFATTDNVYDPSKYDQSCFWIRCRQTSTTFNYLTAKAPALAITGVNFIAGYQILDIPLDSELSIPTATNWGTNWTFVNYTVQDYYGMSTDVTALASSTFTITVTAFGFTQVRYIGIYLLVWEAVATNTNYTRIVSGVGSVGCFYDSGGCTMPFKIQVFSNNTFTTGRTYIASLYDNMYFYGMNRFIVEHDYSDVDFVTVPFVQPPIKFKFTTTTTVLSGTPSDQYTTNFQYTGNSNKFSLRFSYIIDLNFYCPSSGNVYHISAFACDSVCPNGFYPNNTDMLCWKCHQTCATCIGPNPNDCLTCYSSQNRVINNATSSCVCKQYFFYDDGVSFTCPACSVTCLTCTSASNSACTSCNVTDFRYDDGAGSCPCITGYYHNASATCVKCHYTCLTCSGGNADNNCVTCPSVLTTFRNMSTPSKCDCIAGYYNLSPYVVCYPCHYSCKTCSTTAANCGSCQANFNRTILNGTCPCNGGYYDDGTPLCKPCFSTCLNCNGPTRNDCLSCRLSPDNRIINAPTNQCWCRTGFFDFNDTCYACHYSCLNCTSGTATSCSACNMATGFRTLSAATNECLCNSGYYDLSPNPICQVCDFTCETCKFNSTYCLSCRPTDNRILTSFACPCKYGYVDVLGLCTLCHYSCLSCTGITNTTCVDCNLTTRYKSGPTCPCKFGLYDDGTASECKACHIHCLTCIAGTNSSCLTCDPATMRITPAITPDFCYCQTGYYDAGPAACATCSPQCLTCINTAAYCLTCQSSQFRILNASTHICQCQTGYYETGANICPQCASQCSQCVGLSTNCTACPSLRVLAANDCKCIDGYYEDTATKNCLLCNGLCERCTNVSTQCTKCYTSMNRQLQSSACICSFGFYNDSSTPVCQPCPYYCNNCSGLLTCRQCSPSSHRSLVGGLCKCNQGYYDNGANLTCLTCSPVCQQCSDYAVCTVCNPALQRTLTLSQCRCNLKYYDAYTLATPITMCQPCHYSCATCSNATETDCITCEPNRDFIPGNNSCPCLDGYYEASMICYLCDTNCRTCLGLPTNCTSCYSGLPLVNNTCLCFSGQYESASVCYPCDNKCKQCTGVAGYCTQCKASHGTILFANDCICGAGQYKQAVTLICRGCHPTCVNCTGPASNQCIACDGSTIVNRMLNANNQCVCRPGYYLNTFNNTCQACHSACLACVGPSNYNCSICQALHVLIGTYCKLLPTCPNYLYEDTCVNVCPKTSYPTPARLCQKCINGCLYCISALLCTECLPGYYYNTTTYACSVVCQVGAYIDGAGQCVGCPSNCVECQWNAGRGSAVCLKCTPGYYLKDQVQCTSTCVAPSYWPLGSLCLKCLGNCLTCNSLSATDCITCQPNTLFLNSSCYPACPLGYYQVAAQPLCTACPSQCQSCSASQCLSCQSGHYLSESVCTPHGHFHNPSTSLPQLCHPNCLTCTNSSFASCMWCRPYRGDVDELAISGYCQCKSGSIDMGNGLCNTDKYVRLVQITQSLVSYSTATIYLLGLVSVVSVNYMGLISGIGYVQMYSNFYYLNSSIVMNIDNVLQQYRKASINSFLYSQTSKTKLKHPQRLLLQLQTDKSLFLRDQPFEYVIEWGMVPAIVVGGMWALVAALSCALCFCGRSGNRVANVGEISEYHSEGHAGLDDLHVEQMAQHKGQENEDENQEGQYGKNGQTPALSVSSIDQSTCMQYARKFFWLYFESVPIAVHLLLSSEIMFYSVVNFKIIHIEQPQIDITLLSLSCLFFAYMVLYTLRLIIGVYRLTSRLLAAHQYDLRAVVRQRQGSPLRLLFHMHMPAKCKPVNAMYLPLLLLRNQLTSALIVLLSASPTAQIFVPCALVLLFAVYSLVFNPYSTLMRVVFHASDVLLLAQLVLLFLVIQAQYGNAYLQGWVESGSVYVSAWVLLGLNFAQVGLYMGLGAGLIWGLGRKRMCRGKVQAEDPAQQGQQVEEVKASGKKRKNRPQIRLNQQSNETINIEALEQQPEDYAQKYQNLSNQQTPHPQGPHQRTGYPLLVHQRRETDSHVSRDDAEEVIVKRYRLRRKKAKDDGLQMTQQ